MKAQKFPVVLKTRDGSMIADKRISYPEPYLSPDDVLLYARRLANEKGVRIESHTFDEDKGLFAVVAF